MIYLDSAATTFQKPPAVGRAMTEALASMSSPGRGGHPLAMRAADTAFRCRTELAELFGLDGPEGVAFTLNATHALNIAIKSLVPPGGRVVISGYEHNAVTRPLTALKAKVSVAGGPLFNQEAAIRAFDELIAPGVDVVICNHVSNVFGFVQPVEKVAALCRSRGVPLIVDASQSAGILPINMKSLGAAYIAMPGHKGLYGPQGTGVLLCGDGQIPRPLLEGGTGSISLSQEMPDFLPDRIEAGTHNMPGIAGLLAGVRFVRRQGTQTILRHEHALTCRTAESLRRLSGPGGSGVLPGDGAGRGDRGRSAGAAGDRGAGGAALRAAGSPHRRDAGHRHGPGQLFRLQHASGGGPAGGGRGGYSPEIRPKTN